MYIPEDLPISFKTLRTLLTKNSQPSTFSVDGIFTLMGRDAISLAINSLGLTEEHTVLLPAYLCEEVVRPFVGRAKVLFYDLNKDLTINIGYVEELIISHNIKCLFVIHYFGYVHRNTKQLRALCDKYGIYLIEDCSHSILSTRSGQYGDVIVYSLRKQLPLLDGGALQLKFPTIRPTSKHYPQFFSDCISLAIFIKSILGVKEKSLSRNSLSSICKRFSYNDRNALNRRYLSISTFSRYLLTHINIQKVISERRHRFLLWYELLKEAEAFSPFLADLPADVCPLGFPIILKQRDLLRRKLAARGIFLKVHWPLPAKVPLHCSTAWQLSDELVTLPVYPGLQENDIRNIHKMLREVT